MKFSRDKRIIALLLIIFHLLLFTGLYIEGLEPVTQDKKAQARIVEIEKGEGLFSIARKLKREGLIRSVPVFIFEALRQGVYREFKAGEYALYPNQTLKEIFEVLKKGKIYLHKVTVVEGATLWEIAEILEKDSICSKKEFLNLAKDQEFLKSLGLPGPTVEGYLYPETYFFAKKTDPHLVIKVMTDKFKEVWSSFDELASKNRLSMKEVVTLASIVEKEAFFEAEKPIIAAVYLNRLKKGMPLQADPTINYALKDFRRLYIKDYYSVKSPYNTYLHNELPPTPIGNPSKSSLIAVLKPAKVPYLFFVASGDGRHIFSRTYREHLSAIAKIRTPQVQEESANRENGTSPKTQKVSLEKESPAPDIALKHLPEKDLQVLKTH